MVFLVSQESLRLHRRQQFDTSSSIVLELSAMKQPLVKLDAIQRAVEKNGGKIVTKKSKKTSHFLKLSQRDSPLTSRAYQRALFDGLTMVDVDWLKQQAPGILGSSVQPNGPVQKKRKAESTETSTELGSKAIDSKSSSTTKSCSIAASNAEKKCPAKATVSAPDLPAITANPTIENKVSKQSKPTSSENPPAKKSKRGAWKQRLNKSNSTDTSAVTQNSSTSEKDFLELLSLANT